MERWEGNGVMVGGWWGEGLQWKDGLQWSEDGQ